MAREKIRSSKDRVRREAADALASRRFPSWPPSPSSSASSSPPAGIGPDEIRKAAREPRFLAGVLDHFSGNEPLLIAFAQQPGIDPTEVARARALLGGVWERDIP